MNLMVSGLFIFFIGVMNLMAVIVMGMKNSFNCKLYFIISVQS